MKLFLEILGIASDIQSAAEIVDVLKENARAWWISSLGVLVLFVLLLLFVRLKVYWKVRPILKDEKKRNRLRDYTFSELTALYDKKFPESYLTAYHMMFIWLLIGLIVVSVIAGIIQLVVYLKYS